MGPVVTVPAANLERHCYRAGCRCDHAAPCDRGWVENSDAQGEATGTVAPCGSCRPELAEAVLLSTDRADLVRRLQDHRQDPSGVEPSPEWRHPGT